MSPQLGRKKHGDERGLEFMGEHGKVTSTPEDRWRQAARIFAAGAIRAALRAEGALPSKGARSTRPPEGTPSKVPQEFRKAA